MKNRDEYLESIYKKRNIAVKQRKKQITAFATLVPLCAVVVIGISALSSGFFAEKSADMAEAENELVNIGQSATDVSTTVVTTVGDFSDSNNDVIDTDSVDGLDNYAASGGDILDSIPATTAKSQATVLSGNASEAVANVTRNNYPDFIKELYTDYEKLLSALDPEEKIMLDFQAPDDYYIITFIKTGDIYFWTDGAVCFGNEWYGIGPENNEIIKSLILA